MNTKYIYIDESNDGGFIFLKRRQYIALFTLTTLTIDTVNADVRHRAFLKSLLILNSLMFTHKTPKWSVFILNMFCLSKIIAFF